MKMQSARFWDAKWAIPVILGSVVRFQGFWTFLKQTLPVTREKRGAN